MKRRLLFLLAFLALPLALLWPSAVGGRTYIPFDAATFAPASWQYSEEQVAAAKEGANYDITEITAWLVPELRQARAAIVQGKWPGWQSWAHGGTVLQASGVNALLYPPTWIVLAHQDPQSGLWLLAWFHFAVAALLTFGFLRRLGLLPWAAALGAVAFALSGTLCANGPYFQRLGALVWLPGLLWGAKALVDASGSRFPPLLAMASCMALTWVAGFPPYSVAVTVAAVIWCGWLVIDAALRHRRAPQGDPRGVLRVAATQGLWLTAAGAIGVLLAMPHVLPVLDFFANAARSVAPELELVSHSVFPPGGTVGYLMPELFGHMTDTSLPGDRSPLAYLLLPRTEWFTNRPLLPNFNATEYSVFAGTAILILAPLGIWSRRRGGAFAAVTWLLLLGLAGGWPVLRLMYNLPMIPTAAPLRFLGPAALCAAWFGAVGLDRILRGEVRKLTLWIAAVAVSVTALVCLILSWSWDAVSLPESQGWAETIAKSYQGATEIDLDAARVRELFGDNMVRGAERLIAGLGYLGWALLTLGAWLAAAATGLAGPGVLGAVATLATAGQLAVNGAKANQGVHALPSASSPAHETLGNLRRAQERNGGIAVLRAGATVGVPLFLPPGTLVDQKVRDFQAYTYVDAYSSRPFIELHARYLWRQSSGATWEQATPAQRQDARERAAATILGGAVPPNFPDDKATLESPYFDLIGIHYWIAQEPLRHGSTPVIVEVGGRPVHLHPNVGVLPRAFFVPDLRAMPDDEAVLDQLVARDFDPSALALVTDAEAQRATPMSGPKGEPSTGQQQGKPREIEFARDDPGAVVLHVGDGPAGYVVLADTHLPGWSATVREKDTPILRGNLWMRVVAVPAGPCTVRMRYVTPGLLTGLALWGVAATALAALGLWHWTRRRRGSSRPRVRPSDHTV